ncbi:nitrate/nitrite transporter NrtS [Kribbella sp. NPDC026596]|uniref:nitrate/nitrite transporter NrtS n=1 Tax=Kribbella sp. NPDC026596 TaxID=3155122 RepID=UPI0033D540FF
MTTRTAAEACPHSGGRTCPRCSWSRPRDAVLLVVRGRTARKALPVAAVVGTVLSLVNQGSVIAGGGATYGTWVRVAVNYLVPFLVASTGYLSGRRVRGPAVDWPGYVADYHERRSGITEQILGQAISQRGETPYAWLVDLPLQDASGRILDIACGSAPTRELLRRPGWLGLDASMGELAAASAGGRVPLLCARADVLPLPDATVDVVCAAMCLQVLTPVDSVLAEVRRVLRPGGTLVALVPSRVSPLEVWHHRSGIVAWVRVMRALRVRSEPWPNPRARDDLPGLLRGQGFLIDSDRRCVFRRETVGATDAELMIDGLYLPGVESEAIARAKGLLAGWARPGRFLPLPLRRVVAHLPHDRH